MEHCKAVVTSAAFLLGWRGGLEQSTRKMIPVSPTFFVSRVRMARLHQRMIEALECASWAGTTALRFLHIFEVDLAPLPLGSPCVRCTPKALLDGGLDSCCVAIWLCGRGFAAAAAAPAARRCSSLLWVRLSVVWKARLTVLPIPRATGRAALPAKYFAAAKCSSAMLTPCATIDPAMNGIPIAINPRTRTSASKVSSVAPGIGAVQVYAELIIGGPTRLGTGAVIMRAAQVVASVVVHNWTKFCATPSTI